MNVFLATVDGSKALLNEEESWHCAKVLRKKAGDKIGLIDGKGNSYTAVLVSVSDKRCEAEIAEGPKIDTGREYYLHLAVAPTKQMDRMEWMLEKAVEIGIDEVSFIYCRNSERVTLKTQRLEAIALSAVKQSLQATLPKINQPQKFNDFLTKVNGDQKFIASCESGAAKQVNNCSFKGLNTVVLIGPEGDFTMEEIVAANKKGFIHLSLGPNRLRTETAGLYVVQAASLL